MLMNTKKEQEMINTRIRLYMYFIRSVLEPQHYIKSIHTASSIKQTEFSFFLHKAKLEKTLGSQEEMR